mmetsp:Transcript_22788/g.17227  ORF Transcript_22788/g.17227 Transcript_22788/m.17227 type:complete len:95 (+) Transcript_22788:186-470(+)
MQSAGVDDKIWDKIPDLGKFQEQEAKVLWLKFDLNSDNVVITSDAVDEEGVPLLHQKVDLAPIVSEEIVTEEAPVEIPLEEQPVEEQPVEREVE